MLSAATIFSPEQKAFAAALAPAIRARLVLADGMHPRVTFQADARLTAAKLETQSLQRRSDGILLGDVADDVERLYASLAEQLGPSPIFGRSGSLTLGVTGLGSFTVGLSTARGGRLAGKVAIITGSAQGFGEGIAREMAAQGAAVVIADLNRTLAETVAGSIQEAYGEGSALALTVDVGSEESVASLVQDTVLSFGGLDIFVSNAGVLKAGGLEEMDLKAFEFVTRINYTAFFLCAKHAARPMRIQHRFDPEWYGDIIQINSKSGLEGSNRNFAYAGGKFGGIGLVQSFAKELVYQNIKVNAVCPGNYYEGPLWSDPEKGLFVQYLNTGKVPGAKTVQDVYDFYVSKVPMKKGCSPKDVARAIYYLVEQTNETGQALPVTGGQNMLH